LKRPEIHFSNLFEFDLKDFIRVHEEKEAMMTIALTRVERVEEYGIADLDKDLRIMKFVEKPRADKAPSNLANAGIYLLSPEVRKIVESEEVKKIKEAMVIHPEYCDKGEA
jgi:NDP-sugar pyrophosphorylase family protein